MEDILKDVVASTRRCSNARRAKDIAMRILDTHPDETLLKRLLTTMYNSLVSQPALAQRILPFIKGRTE